MALHRIQFLTTYRNHILYTRISGDFQKDHLSHQEEEENTI